MSTYDSTENLNTLTVQNLTVDNLTVNSSAIFPQSIGGAFSYNNGDTTDTSGGGFVPLTLDNATDTSVGSQFVMSLVNPCQLIYNGALPKSVVVIGSVSFTSPLAFLPIDIGITIAQNGSPVGTYVDVSLPNGNNGSLSISSVVNLSTGDTFEIYVQNFSNASPINFYNVSITAQ